MPHLIESSSTSSQKVALPFDMDDKFVVFSVSEWTNRKNFQCLIRSFIMEFHDNDDAFLLLKNLFFLHILRHQRQKVNQRRLI